MSVPIDTVKEIQELSLAGHGRNQISALTGINPGTVRNILDGKDTVAVCEQMTNRQRSDLLMGWGPPGSGRAD